MKIVSRFIWIICKVCWLVVTVLSYVFGFGFGVSWLGVILTFIFSGLKDKDQIATLFIGGAVCLPLFIGCDLLAEKVGDICDDMA